MKTWTYQDDPPEDDDDDENTGEGGGPASDPEPILDKPGS
jgi:hypothetical protein